ncbi:hypothetical protein P3T18_000089 [Paraburkholderia sp. GAS199]
MPVGVSNDHVGRLFQCHRRPRRDKLFSEPRSCFGVVNIAHPSGVIQVENLWPVASRSYVYLQCLIRAIVEAKLSQKLHCSVQVQRRNDACTLSNGTRKGSRHIIRAGIKTLVEKVPAIGEDAFQVFAVDDSVEGKRLRDDVGAFDIAPAYRLQHRLVKIIGCRIVARFQLVYPLLGRFRILPVGLVASQSMRETVISDQFIRRRKTPAPLI